MNNQIGDRPRTPDSASVNSRSRNSHHEPSSLTLSYTDLPGMRDSFETDEDKFRTVFDVGGNQSASPGEEQLQALRARAMAKLDAVPPSERSRGSIMKPNSTKVNGIDDVIVAKNGDAYLAAPGDFGGGRNGYGERQRSMETNRSDSYSSKVVTEQSITTEKSPDGVTRTKRSVTCRTCDLPSADLSGQIHKFNCEDRPTSKRCGCSQRVHFSDNSRPVTPINDELEREERSSGCDVPKPVKPVCVDEPVQTPCYREPVDVCNEKVQTERACPLKMVDSCQNNETYLGCPMKQTERCEAVQTERGCPVRQIDRCQNAQTEDICPVKQTDACQTELRCPGISAIEKIACTAKEHEQIDECMQTGIPVETSKTVQVKMEKLEAAQKTTEEKVIFPSNQKPAEPNESKEPTKKDETKSKKKKKSKNKSKKKSLSKSKKKKKSKGKSKEKDQKSGTDVETSPSVATDKSGKPKSKKKKKGDHETGAEEDDEEVPRRTFFGIPFGKSRKKRHKSISTEDPTDATDAEESKTENLDGCAVTTPTCTDDAEQCSPNMIVDDLECARKARNRQLKDAMPVFPNSYPSNAAGWMSDEECAPEEKAEETDKCEKPKVPDAMLLLTDEFTNEQLCRCEAKTEKRKKRCSESDKEINDRSYSSLGFAADCQRVLEPSYKSVGCGDINVKKKEELNCSRVETKEIPCKTNRRKASLKVTAPYVDPVQNYDENHVYSKSELAALILNVLRRMELTEQQTATIQSESKHLTEAGQCLYQTKKELEKRVKNLNQRLENLMCKKKTLQSECSPAAMEKISQKATCIKQQLNRELCAEQESYEAAKRCLNRTVDLYENLMCNIQSQWCQEYTQLKGENAVLDAEFYRTQAALRQTEAEMERLCAVNSQPLKTSCESPLDRVNCALAAAQPSTRKLLEEARKDRLTHFEQLLDIRCRYQTALSGKMKKTEQYYASFQQQCIGLFKGVYYVLHHACPSEPLLLQPAVCRFVLSAKCMDVCMVEDNLRAEKARTIALQENVEEVQRRKERMACKLTEMAAQCRARGAYALLPKLHGDIRCG